MGAQGSADGRRGETLAHEKLVDARILGLRGNLRLAAELLLEGFGNQRALVGLAERRRERLSRNVLLDAHFLQLALDAQASASFDLHRRPHVLRGSEPLWLTSSLRPICRRSVRSSECLVWPAPWRRAPRRAWRGWRASTPSRRAPCPR